MSTRSGHAPSERELELVLSALRSERDLLAAGRWEEAVAASARRVEIEDSLGPLTADAVPADLRRHILGELDACRALADALRREALGELETLAREREALHALAAENATPVAVSAYLDRHA